MNSKDRKQHLVFNCTALTFKVFQQRKQCYKETQPGGNDNLPVVITMRSPSTRFGYQKENKYRKNKGKQRI